MKDDGFYPGLLSNFYITTQYIIYLYKVIRSAGQQKTERFSHPKTIALELMK